MLKSLFAPDGPRMPPTARFGLESLRGYLRPNRTTENILEPAGSPVESDPRGQNSTDSQRASATTGFIEDPVEPLCTIGVRPL